MVLREGFQKVHVEKRLAEKESKETVWNHYVHKFRAREIIGMKNELHHTLTKAVLLGLLASTTAMPAYAASSLAKPGQDIEGTLPEVQAGVENSMKKNTATNEVQFLVKNIQLDVEDEIKLNNAEIRDILLPRIGKETTLAGLNDLQDQITAYCRSHGYPAAAAYLPTQESEDGNVIIKVIPGRYGDVKLDNKSRFKDAAADGFLAGLKKGEIIRTKDLETALYTISDFSGTRAVGTLSAGKSFGSSDVTVHIEDGKPNSTILYAENYGGESTGRYRYGAQHSMYNVDGMGAKVNVGALISNKSLHNYYVNYETLAGRGGTSLGIGYSRMDYEVGGPLKRLGAHGTADTISIYGSRPIYHTTDEKLAVTYGYDYRRLKDDLDAFGGLADSEKHSHNVHAGVEGFWRDRKNGLSLSYNFVLTVGNITADSEYAKRLAELSDTDGSFTKAEAKVTAVQSLGKRADVMVKLSGQAASKHLDSSEQMYIGGANAVRAYPQGAGTGDSGLLGTVEFRYYTNVPGLVASTYFDAGRTSFDGETTTLKGWGLGLAYNASDWFARLDYARRIGLPYGENPNTDRGRFWFLAGKIW